MTDSLSTHLPAVSGGIESVTGTLVVDTGLRNVQTIVACAGEDHTADVGGVSVTIAAVVGGGTVKATLSVWEDDQATPGTAATAVHWMAIGK